MVFLLRVFRLGIVMKRYMVSLFFFVLASPNNISAQEVVKKTVVSSRVEAYKKIALLEDEKDAILSLLGQVALPEQSKRLQEIESEIYQMKLFTGDIGGKEKKIFLGTIALLGLSSVAFWMYMLYSINEVKRYWN